MAMGLYERTTLSDGFDAEVAAVTPELLVRTTEENEPLMHTLNEILNDHEKRDRTQLNYLPAAVDHYRLLAVTFAALDNLWCNDCGKFEYDRAGEVAATR